MRSDAKQTHPDHPAIHIVLFQPEIPQNTGNIGRLCAYNRLRLHLIHPLGFTITSKHLRLSGMDYWKDLDLFEHRDWKAFVESEEALERTWLFTTRGTRFHWDAEFRRGDYLLFGNEGSGCPEEIHATIPEPRKLKIPQLAPGLRSLNLSTSVGIAAYEALRGMTRAEGDALY